MSAVSKKHILKITLAIAAIIIFFVVAFLYSDANPDNLQQAVMYGNTAKVKWYLTISPELAKEKTFHGYTNLHWAAMDGNIEIAKALIKHGANVNAASNNPDSPTNKENVTPLFLAAQHGHADMVRLLLKHKADIEVKADYFGDIYGRTNGGNTINGYSPLMIAAENGQADVVAALLDAGADANCTNKNKETPLGLAEYNYNQKSNPVIIKALIAHGAKQTKKSADTRSPLVDAAVDHNYKLVKKLLEAGADANETCVCGNPSLLHMSYEEDPEDKALKIAALLVAHGANIDFKEKDGYTLVNSIWRSKKALKYFIKKGLKIDEPLKSIALEDTAKLSAFIKANPTFVNKAFKKGKTNNYSFTLLVKAIDCDSIPAIKVLLDAGAKTVGTKKTKYDYSDPIDHAVMSKNTELFMLVLDHTNNPNLQKLLYQATQYGRIDNVKLLISKGADINRGYNSGIANCDTALQAAVSSSNLEMVKFLILKGVRVKMKSDRDYPILWCLMQTSYDDKATDIAKIADLLVQNGAEVNPSKSSFESLSDLASNPRPGMLKLLLEHGADPNAQSEYGGRALNNAHDPETIRILLQYGATESHQSGPKVNFWQVIKDFFQRILHP